MRKRSLVNGYDESLTEVAFFSSTKIAISCHNSESPRKLLVDLIESIFRDLDQSKANVMESTLKANEQAKNHGIDLSKLPQNLDMNAESITANVHAINANCQFTNLHCFKNLMLNWMWLLGPDERMKFVFKSLVGGSEKSPF